MSYRWILPLAGLVMAGCASTAPVNTPSQTTAVQNAPLPERSRTATVDEHLFKPSTAKPVKTTPPALPEFDSVYARMVASFALPACDEHEESR